MNVLILGAAGNAGRNVLKCLAGSALPGADGRLYAADADPVLLHLTGLPAAQRLVMPSAGVVEWLGEVVQRLEIGFVHAQPDSLVGLLAGTVGPASPLFPRMVALSNEAAGQCKLGFARRWWSLAGEPCPAESMSDLTPERFAGLAAAGNGRVWLRCRRGAGARGALPVSDFFQGLGWVRWWIRERGLVAEDFMAEPFRPGPEYAVQQLWWEGRLIASAARERVRHFFAAQSVSGTSSTPSVARSVRDPALTALAGRAARCLMDRPHGIFGVDVRHDCAGRPVPTEVNYGRCFTTVDFFAALGLNFPALLLRCFRGDAPAAPLPEPEPGWTWLRGLDTEPVLLPPAVVQ